MTSMNKKALLVAIVLFASACGSTESSTAPGASTDTSPTTEATESIGTGSSATTDSASSTDSAGSPEAPAGDPTATLEWSESGLSGETLSATFRATDSGFVAYDHETTSEALVSPSGVAWTTAPLDLGSTTGDVDFHGITPGGPGYVAFGMVSGEVMRVSEDGLSWESRGLDLEYPPLGVFESVEAESVVVGNDGYVMVGRMDRGSPDEHRFFVWASDDGSAWDLVADAFPEGAYIGEVLPFNGGFIVQGFVDGPDGGGPLWVSADGRSWDEVTTEAIDPGSDPESIDLAHQGLAIWGDKILAAGQTEDGVRLWTSLDGRDWEQLPAPSLPDQSDQGEVRLEQVFAGPLGIVLVGEFVRAERPQPPLVLEKDEVILTLDFGSEAGRITVEDRSTGALLIEGTISQVAEGEVENIAFSDDFSSITVVHPDTGQETTFTEEDFEQARIEANEAAGFDPESGGEDLTTPVIWFSPDGQRWTVVDLKENFGLTSLPGENFVVVGNDAVLLRWIDYPEDEEGSESDQHSEDGVDVIWVGALASGS